MMLLVWVGLCGLLAIGLYRRPVLAVCVYLTLGVLVPASADGVLTGAGQGRPAAADWVIFTAFAVQVFRHPRVFADVLTRRFVFFAVIFLTLAVAVYETKIGAGGHGLVKVIDEVLAPLLAFWILGVSARLGMNVSGTVVRTIIGLAAFEAAFALVQYTTKSTLLYASAYQLQHAASSALLNYSGAVDLTKTAGYDRWKGTTDSALYLAVILVGALPLLRTVRSAVLRNALLVLLLAGILATQSRVGVVLGALAVGYVLLTGGRWVLGRVVSIGALIAVGAYVAGTKLTAGVIDRVNGVTANGTNSTLARQDAYGYFAAHFQDYLLHGTGVDSSYRLASRLGLASSFESAFIMYSIDLGVVFAAAFFLALAVSALLSSSRDHSGAWLGALLVIIFCQTFSSIGAVNPIGALIFVLLAAAAYPTVPAGATDRSADPPADDSAADDSAADDSAADDSAADDFTADDSTYEPVVAAER